MGSVERGRRRGRGGLIADAAPLFSILSFTLSLRLRFSLRPLSLSLSLSISVSQGTRLEASAAEAAVDHRRVLFGGGHV